MRALCLLVAVAVAVLAADNKGTNAHKWADTALTTSLWRTISDGDVDDLKSLLESNPEAAVARSGDGRGPLWWAYEYDKPEMVAALVAAGASEDEKDADGKTPKQVAGKVGPTEFAAAGGSTVGGGDFDPEAYDIPDDDDE